MIRVRPYHPSDFPLLDKWWRAHNLCEDDLSRSHFPECSGALVETEDGPVAVAFLFMVYGCGVAFIERFLTAPGTPPKVIREAGYLVDSMLTELARVHDYGVIISTFERPGMAREAEKLGFEEVTRNMIMMKKKLWPQQQ